MGVLYVFRNVFPFSILSFFSFSFSPPIVLHNLLDSTLVALAGLLGGWCAGRKMCGGEKSAELVGAESSPALGPGP